MDRSSKDTMKDGMNDIPHDLHDLAEQIRALPEDAPEGLETRVFDASVAELREGGRVSVAGRIGPLRWLAPLAAAAAVALLAWAGSSLLGPSTPTTTEGPRVASNESVDEHVSDVLAYADLFGEADWSDTLVEEAEALDQDWEPTVEAWSLDGSVEAG
ncbi:MAG: hypothetical protein RIB58_11615 [Phycisphaerales bacterium]|jgi:hypothetical protein